MEFSDKLKFQFFFDLTKIISGSRYPTQQYGEVYVIRWPG